MGRYSTEGDVVPSPQQQEARLKRSDRTRRVASTNAQFKALTKKGSGRKV